MKDTHTVTTTSFTQRKFSSKKKNCRRCTICSLLFSSFVHRHALKHTSSVSRMGAFTGPFPSPQKLTCAHSPNHPNTCTHQSTQILGRNNQGGTKPGKSTQTLNGKIKDKGSKAILRKALTYATPASRAGETSMASLGYAAFTIAELCIKVSQPCRPCVQRCSAQTARSRVTHYFAPRFSPSLITHPLYWQKVV